LDSKLKRRKNKKDTPRRKGGVRGIQSSEAPMDSNKLQINQEFQTRHEEEIGTGSQKEERSQGIKDRVVEVIWDWIKEGKKWLGY